MRWMPPKCKTPHFPMPHSSSSVEFGITGYYDPGWPGHAGSRDTDLHYHVPISAFVATRNHNPTTSQTETQTDRHTDRRTDVCS